MQAFLVALNKILKCTCCFTYPLKVELFLQWKESKPGNDSKWHWKSQIFGTFVQPTEAFLCDCLCCTIDHSLVGWISLQSHFNGIKWMSNNLKIKKFDLNAGNVKEFLCATYHCAYSTKASTDKVLDRRLIVGRSCWLFLRHRNGIYVNNLWTFAVICQFLG